MTEPDTDEPPWGGMVDALLSSELDVELVDVVRLDFRGRDPFNHFRFGQRAVAVGLRLRIDGVFQTYDLPRGC